MGLMILLRPTRITGQATLLVRTGRFIHWIGLGIASAILVAAAFSAWDEIRRYQAQSETVEGILGPPPPGSFAEAENMLTNPSPPSPELRPLIFMVVAAASTALIGRGIRYVLSAE